MGARSPQRQVPTHASVCDDARLQSQVRASSPSVPVVASGPNSTRKLFVVWVAACVSSCSTICVKECSRRIFMTRRSIRSIVMCWPITVRWPCRRVKDPDRKGKVEAGVGHAQKTHSKGNALRVWRQRRLISIAGRQTGPTPAFTAPPNDKWPRCLPKSDRTCCHYH